MSSNEIPSILQAKKMWELNDKLIKNLGGFVFFGSMESEHYTFGLDGDDPVERVRSLSLLMYIVFHDYGGKFFESVMSRDNSELYKAVQFSYALRAEFAHSPTPKTRKELYDGLTDLVFKDQRKGFQDKFDSWDAFVENAGRLWDRTAKYLSDACGDIYDRLKTAAEDTSLPLSRNINRRIAGAAAFDQRVLRGFRDYLLNEEVVPLECDDEDWKKTVNDFINYSHNSKNAESTWLKDAVNEFYENLKNKQYIDSEELYNGFRSVLYYKLFDVAPKKLDKLYDDILD